MKQATKDKVKHTAVGAVTVSKWAVGAAWFITKNIVKVPIKVCEFVGKMKTEK